MWEDRVNFSLRLGWFRIKIDDTENAEYSDSGHSDFKARGRSAYMKYEPYNIKKNKSKFKMIIILRIFLNKNKNQNVHILISCENIISITEYRKNKILIK